MGASLHGLRHPTLSPLASSPSPRCLQGGRDVSGWVRSDSLSSLWDPPGCPLQQAVCLALKQPNCRHILLIPTDVVAPSTALL